MTKNTLAEIAESLYQAWKSRTPIPPLNPDLSPATRQEAYAIQDHLAHLINQPVIGWKVGATTENARQAGGHDGLIPGRIFKSNLFNTGGHFAATQLNHGKVEAEIALLLTEDLPLLDRPYMPTDFDGRVQSYAALELVASRFKNGPASSYELIADNGIFAALVVGPELKDWPDFNPETLEIDLTITGETVQKPANLWGSNRAHPMTILVEIANLLKVRNISLAKGNYISTGTMTVQTPLAKGDKIHADFGGLAQIDFTIN